MTKPMTTTTNRAATGTALQRTSVSRSASRLTLIRPEVHAPQKHSTRKTAKKSIPAGFWMALFSWIIAIFIMSGSLNEAFSLANVEPRQMEVQVEKGDTLWSIAQEINTTIFNHNYDVRYLIYVIEEANGLENAIIHPGQILVIPLDLN